LIPCLPIESARLDAARAEQRPIPVRLAVDYPGDPSVASSATPVAQAMEDGDIISFGISIHQRELLISPVPSR
jgi:hypothetical protein